MPTLPRAENWPKRVMAAAVLTWVSSIQSLLVFCVSSRLHHGWGPALKNFRNTNFNLSEISQKLTQLQLRWPPSLLRAIRTPKRDAPRCHAEPAAELLALRAEGRWGRFQIEKAVQYLPRQLERQATSSTSPLASCSRLGVVSPSDKCYRGSVPGNTATARIKFPNSVRPWLALEVGTTQ